MRGWANVCSLEDWFRRSLFRRRWVDKVGCCRPVSGGVVLEAEPVVLQFPRWGYGEALRRCWWTFPGLWPAGAPGAAWCCDSRCRVAGGVSLLLFPVWVRR